VCVCGVCVWWCVVWVCVCVWCVWCVWNIFQGLCCVCGVCGVCVVGVEYFLRNETNKCTLEVPQVLSYTCSDEALFRHQLHTRLSMYRHQRVGGAETPQDPSAILRSVRTGGYWCACEDFDAGALTRTLQLILCSVRVIIRNNLRSNLRNLCDNLRNNLIIYVIYVIYVSYYQGQRYTCLDVALPWMNTSVSALAVAVVECIENLLHKP
jgi:hypothetical protein